MVKLRITNLPEFEARLSGGVKNLTNATFKEVKKDAAKFFGGLADNVAQTTEYKRLASDSELRGKLGLAIASRKSGGDTDAPDLIASLSKFKIKVTSNGSTRKFNVVFPSLQELEDKLTHNLSKINKGVITRGRKASWFRWWEHGDRGEINSLTVLRKTISKIVSNKSGKSKNKKSRTQLLELLSKRSRSNEAIQLRNLRPDENSHISPTKRIQTTYANFARIFPARMGKTLKKIVARNGGRAEKFFARGVVR